ncbi:nucleotidyltransferase [Cyclobacterium sp. SYSU L10401]|uniref:nucleotidyltransferase domain-containing protein n=1 Tax=Cyclobacterium sp. SYSU L10401 TaxID=2678657 RepID=UPI0013D29A17|nr:nucleotidyltransferase [Cyclobacterium sp. SYSU L10401]
MLTTDQKKQFSELLEELGQSLDISEGQYDAAVKSYQAVGNQLSKEGSTLAPYKPEILPQGSFLLGTMVKPVNENDDLDIDLVCKLTGKQPSWTQYNLKQKVGDQLKENELYRKMLKEEGRRCWTLVYANSANYHMDILPSVVDTGYQMILEKAFLSAELTDLNELAIRITDKQRDDYYFENNHKLWLKCNPFGYGKWFSVQASLDLGKRITLSESIKPVPQYQKDKLPLQRVVQILKRHRDLMFNGDEDKPISIIITTLAARAYQKEVSTLDALLNVINRMHLFIQEKFNPKTGRMIKWIGNPVNEEENFADKWEETPQKKIIFYKWLEAVQADVRHVFDQKDRGLQWVIEALKTPFGEKAVTKAFSNYGDKQLLLRESGGMKMAGVTGAIGSVGRTSIPKHTNFGAKKDQ